MWETWRWSCPTYPQSTCRSLQSQNREGRGLNKLLIFTVLSTARSHENTINPNPREHFILIKGQNLRTKNPQKAPNDNSSCCSIHLWKPWQKGTGRSSLPSHNVTIHLCDMSVTLTSPWSSNCHLQTRLLTQNTPTKPLPTTPDFELKVRGWGYCSAVARVCFIDRNTPGRLAQTEWVSIPQPTDTVFTCLHTQEQRTNVGQKLTGNATEAQFARLNLRWCKKKWLAVSCRGC